MQRRKDLKSVVREEFGLEKLSSYFNCKEEFNGSDNKDAKTE